MIKKAIRNCPVCAWEEVEFLHRQKFILLKGHPLPDQYDVVCCERCGLVYADTPAGQEAYDNYYAEFSKYIDSKTSIGSGDTLWDRDRLDSTARQIAEYGMDPQSCVLDIGCAKGGLLTSLQKFGFKHLYGLDLSPICVAEVRQRGFQALQGSLLQLPEKIGIFDCVVLSHILEHVRDVHLAIQYVLMVIKPQGHIYIEVPDASRYIEQASSPFQDFNVEHINHFSQLSLANLMQPFGFTLKGAGQKEVALGPKLFSPVLYSFWEKSAQTGSSFSWVQDVALKNSLMTYIRESKAVLSVIDAKLQSVLNKSPQVIIWGTGQLAIKLLAETCLAQAQIMAFVDGNPANQGRMFFDIPVLAPGQIQNMPFPILVTTILHEREIVDEIHQMGLPNDIILLGK